MTTPPTPPTDNPMCPTKGCAYPMPHEHAAATASALTVADLSRLYDEALADYEGALVSRDPERRASAEARLQATARALSQAQSRQVAGRANGQAAPSWDALLSDPTQQLDTEGVVFRSVMPTPPTDNLAAEGGPIWLSTWPANGKPTYAEHDTQQQAEAHAAEVVRSGKAAVATAFEAPQSAEHATPGLGDHRGDDRPAGGGIEGQA